MGREYIRLVAIAAAKPMNEMSETGQRLLLAITKDQGLMEELRVALNSLTASQVNTFIRNLVEVTPRLEENKGISRPQAQLSFDDDLARIMRQYEEAIKPSKKENPRWRNGAKNPWEAECRYELQKSRNSPNYAQLKANGFANDNSYEEIWAIALKDIKKEKDLKKEKKVKEAFGYATMKNVTDDKLDRIMKQYNELGHSDIVIMKFRNPCVEDSEPCRLHSTSPEFELPTYEANTVLEVLEIRAEQMGLPKAAAASLEMEFSGAFISHEKTLKEAGLCDQAEISVHGEAKAKAKAKDMEEQLLKRI